MVGHFVTHIHATFSILTYIFEAVTKLVQLHKRLHDTSGFCHFPHKSMRNSCLDSSARYRAENPSASAWISVSARAGNSRNVSEKCKLSVSSTVSGTILDYNATLLKESGCFCTNILPIDVIRARCVSFAFSSLHLLCT